MAELLTTAALTILLVSLGIGIVVGATGMGGGALLTPALIFLGIPPTAAVANDLVASAITRSVGASVHWRRGTVDRPLVRYLVCGSVPAALLGAAATAVIGDSDTWLRPAIGGTLLLAAATYVLKLFLGLRHPGGRTRVTPPATAGPNGPANVSAPATPGAGGPLTSGANATVPAAIRPAPTVAIGAVGGFLVGLTSVGSGSVMMVALLLLYPALGARRLVGTDTAAAIPLVVAAAVAHVVISGVDWPVLIPLLVGGIPGTYVGARLATRLPQGVIRRGIVLVLTLTGLLLLHVPAAWVGAIGAVLVILGPAAWALLRDRVLRLRFQ